MPGLACSCVARSTRMCPIDAQRLRFVCSATSRAPSRTFSKSRLDSPWPWVTMQNRCAPAASAARACSRICSGSIIACIGVSASAKRDCAQNPQSSAQPPDFALTSEHRSVASPKRSCARRPRALDERLDLGVVGELAEAQRLLAGDERLHGAQGCQAARTATGARARQRAPGRRGAAPQRPDAHGRPRHGQQEGQRQDLGRVAGQAAVGRDGGQRDKAAGAQEARGRHAAPPRAQPQPEEDAPAAQRQNGPDRDEAVVEAPEPAVQAAEVRVGPEVEDLGHDPRGAGLREVPAAELQRPPGVAERIGPDRLEGQPPLEVRRLDVAEADLLLEPLEGDDVQALRRALPGDPQLLGARDPARAQRRRHGPLVDLEEPVEERLPRLVGQRGLAEVAPVVDHPGADDGERDDGDERRRPQPRPPGPVRGDERDGHGQQRGPARPA